MRSEGKGEEEREAEVSVQTFKRISSMQNR